MIVLAETKDSEALLLVERRGAEEGQVFDRAQNKLYPPQPVGSLLIRGGWRPYKGTEDVETMLRDATHVEPLTEAM